MFGIRRWPIVPTIVVLAAAAVMVALGFWQLDRLDQKEAMIAEYSANAGRAVVPLRGDDDVGEYLYREVDYACPSAGEWRAIAGRSASAQSGYAHEFVCVEPVESEFDDVAYSPGIFAAIGWSRGPERPEWNGGSIRGILAPAGDDFRVVSEEGLAGLEPLAQPDPNDLPNNHLAYAVQWFFFALTALVIYVLALRRKQRES